MHCSKVFWLSKFPFRNQLLLWWVFLYMWLESSLASFNTLSLLYILSVLAMRWCGNFLFWSYLFRVLHVSYICMGEVLFYDFVEDLIYNSLGILFSHYAYNLKIWSFHGVPHFLCVLFLWVSFSSILSRSSALSSSPDILSAAQSILLVRLSFECCRMFVHCVKMLCCDWCNKSWTVHS